MLNNVNIIALFSATMSTLAEVAINHPDNGNSEEENRLFPSHFLRWEESWKATC